MKLAKLEFLMVLSGFSCVVGPVHFDTLCKMMAYCDAMVLQNKISLVICLECSVKLDDETQWFLHVTVCY